MPMPRGECRDADWTPPVLLVSARDGVGIEALAEAIGAHFKHLSAGGQRTELHLSERVGGRLHARRLFAPPLAGG